jgi:hypothetical protein
LEQRRYITNGDKVAGLISEHIYNPISAIVEEGANFYDADATEVNIDFTEEDINGNVYITEIRIYGDGEGFSKESLANINILVDSSKKEEIYTKKFRRVKLGSFGIAFVALGTLGSEIEIYSKSEENVYLYRKVIKKEGVTTFSNITILNDCNKIKYESGCMIIIKNCRILKKIFFRENILQHKLSFLPIENNFEIYLCNNKIHRFKIDYENSYKCEFEFNIDNIPFHAKIFYSRDRIEKDNAYYRGVFLIVNKRIIDWNIFDEIADKITTSGSTSTRIHGYIEVEDILFTNNLKASRDGIRDYSLSLEIASILRKNISGINKKANKYYEWGNTSKNKKEYNKISDEEKLKNKDISKDINKKNISTLSSSKMAISERPKFYKINERIEMAEKRLRNCNGDLKRLGVKFHYDAENEIETIIIAVQLWQLGLLDINLIQAITNDSPDGIIFTKNNELKFIEFEKSLSNFFIHDHDYNKTNYILCWDANMSDIEKVLKKVANKFSRYIESICYDNEKCEIKVNDCDGTCCKIKVYVLSKIIKYMKV